MVFSEDTTNCVRIIHIKVKSLKISLNFLHVNVRIDDLPTGSFSENDIVLMHLSVSFNEFDASIILPMSHGLFE